MILETGGSPLLSDVDMEGRTLGISLINGNVVAGDRVVGAASAGVVGTASGESDVSVRRRTASFPRMDKRARRKTSANLAVAIGKIEDLRIIRSNLKVFVYVLDEVVKNWFEFIGCTSDARLSWPLGFG